MIWKIARKEFTDMIRDGRFRWAAAIVFGLLLMSLAMGWKHYREVSAQRDEASRAMREQWLTQGEKNPHSAAHYSIYAIKPKMPLSLIDRGVEPYTGVAIYLEAHSQNDFLYRPARDATALQRFGELTASVVLQLFVPLLIIILSFSAFAGERESGTLRQVLSLGVRKRDLAYGKALGVTAALALLLVPAATLGVLALSLSATDGAPSSSGAQLALMAGGFLLYFAIYVGVSLAVSALAPSSRLALVILLGFWIVNGFAAPRVASDLAKRVHPSPSAFEFTRLVNQDLKNGIDGHSPEDRRRAELEARVLAQYGVGRVEDLPVNFDGIVLQESEEYGNRIFDKHYASLWETFERQNRLQQGFGLLAPLLAVRSLSMGLAGTDWAQHRDFAAAAESYRRMLVKTMNEDMIRNSRTGDTEYRAGRELWERVPEFRYSLPPAAQVLRGQVLSVAALLAWLALAVTASLWAASRMSVD